MATMPKARATIVHHEGGARVALEGTIEADFDPGDVGALKGCLVLDLDGVTRITSYGVREWLRFLQGCAADSIVFLNAHANMVAQFNVVAGFAGRGALASCYLPYICESCETEFERPLDVAQERDVVTGKEPPKQTCPKCGAEAEFDDVPASYFSYLASQPPVVLTDAAVRIIRGEARPAERRPLTVRKEVTGAVTGLWLSGTLDNKARLKRAADGTEGHVAVVCAGIDVAEEEGVKKLAELRALPGARVVFARVPRDLLRVIAKEARSEMRGGIASILWPMHCGVCAAASHGEIEAPFEPEKAANGLSVPARCERCGTRGFIPMDQARETLLAYFLAPSLAGEVLTYLHTHLGASPPLAVAVEAGTSGSGKHVLAPKSKYRLIRPLGEGGMAEVFLAEHVGPDEFRKKVVVKRILPRLEKNIDFVRMFLQEARVAARINHPNVVQIFDLGQDDGRHFMAMEYVRGWDLRAIMRAASAAGGVPFEMACRIAADMCAGLHAAHNCVDEDHAVGIVHRDVSPHNVLVSTDGSVKITDFGISKVAESNVKTRPGVIKGKIIYMAPEQIDGDLGPVDAQSDVFAVGLVLHEMLTGSAVFKRDNEHAQMRAVLAAPIQALRDTRPDASASLDLIVARAVERDRSKRYRTAQELRLDLENELASSGRACTSTHLASWLDGLMNKDGTPGLKASIPTAATPSAMLMEGGGDLDDDIVVMSTEDETDPDEKTQRIDISDELRRSLKSR